MQHMEMGQKSILVSPIIRSRRKMEYIEFYTPTTSMLKYN